MDDVPYFFVSHANKDKKRIAPIVRELVCSEIAVWIDKPQHPDLGLSKEALQRLSDSGLVGSIEKGSYWDEAVLNAVERAAGVIAFCSKNALQSTEFLMELGAAYANRQRRVSERYYPVFCVYLDGYAIRRGDFRTSRTQAFNYSGQNARNHNWESTSLAKICRSHLSNMRGMVADEVYRSSAHQFPWIRST